MRQYFDHTFWKTVTGFLVIIFLVLIIDLAINYYNEEKMGSVDRSTAEAQN